MNIELSESQQDKLIQIILATKLGSLNELSKLTKYNQIELKHLINKYPNIREAVEVKKQSQTEKLIELGLESIQLSTERKEGIMGRADVDLMKTILDGIGTSYGYGKQDNSININNSNNVVMELSDEELEMELQQLEELSNNVSITDDKPKSYLSVSNPDNKKDTTKSKENKTKK